jgi:CopG family transcriptional regulator/antitoxin EndoAI
MISLPEEFLAEVDTIARAEHRNRSELLREAVRLYIKTYHAGQRPRDEARIRQAIAVQDKLGRLALGKGEDSTLDIRYWREKRSLTEADS